MRTRIAWRGMLVMLICTAPGRAQRADPESFVVRRMNLDVAIDFAARRLAGSTALDMENWTTRPAGRVSLLMHRLMEASEIRDDMGKPLHFTQDVLRFPDNPIRQVTQLVVDLPQPVAPGRHTTVRIDYAGHVTPYSEIGWLYVRDRIDTAFTILRADALAFPIIGGMSEGSNRRAPPTEFMYDAAVRVPSGFAVAAGGTRSRTPNADGTITWRYRSDAPSPFLNISIARFDTLSDNGIHIFHFRDDSAGARQLMANAQAAMRTLSQWFGPQRGNVNLTITEIPDGWGSQANRFGGIIQTAAAFKDAQRSNELYHELSHLWNVRDTDVPSPRWNEGLATFLEALLQERVNGWTGRAAYESRLVSRLQERLKNDSVLRATPFAAYGTRQIANNAYTVGGVMFAVLYDLVGEREFNNIVGGYYQQFADGGSARDLAAYARRASKHDRLAGFFDDWLFTTRWTSLVASAASVNDLVEHYRRTNAR